MYMHTLLEKKMNGLNYIQGYTPRTTWLDNEDTEFRNTRGW